MSEEKEAEQADLVGLTADIVSAYVAKNALPVTGLPDLISLVHSTLSGIGHPTAAQEPIAQPAVNPKRSVTPDFIICLEDGKKFKSLKRHLSVHYGLTPEQYREKWGLAREYPMVAPNYAAQRSALAKSSGLGRKPGAKATQKATTKRTSPRR
ncbi:MULTISPECIES: MucR family transcriptional regulator [Mesorhizobium]|uniref:MucR family transcriptional regulator n=1 Tax=Mesorhizobium TaxID=68287 RepID=UPI0007ECBF6D|nr:MULTISPECIES: MucR family transcriptional regulator [Mesorhizobium]TPJ40405.1 transcriptional regulator [Mesorhizobium sp. B2-6-6]ARP67214.1 transcriptional regulator [Mesorhizobium sp. WSM1497]MCA0002799.1 MucR family transcriptional regulator [Mesorhizobium sp. B264B2A]MCA0009050.1 MucR family transcriptional regulator [Mesorhizobium sp. B264B1B]MCA0014553.1 MucR family transcriptional regulator [Mesorhizobium sp. B294B1A1]